MTNTRGFTLIEILIALFIFSIIAVIVATALHQVVNTHDRMRTEQKQYANIQNIRAWLWRDLSQRVNPNLITDSNDIIPLKGNKQQIDFIRGGYLNLNPRLKRSSLIRVNYKLQQGHLLRTAQTYNSFSQPQALALRYIGDHIQALSFRYLGPNKRFYYVWPMAKAKQQTSPYAVEVFIRMQNGASLRWLL